MIHDEIVTYEVAMLAKYRGFNVATEMYYHIHRDKDESQTSLESTGCGRRFYNSTNTYRCAAPTQSLLQRWLREEKGIHITVVSEPTTTTDSNTCYQWSVNWDSDGVYYDTYNCSEEEYSTYELALEDALKYVLKKLV